MEETNKETPTDLGEVRTIEDALKLEHVLSTQKGEKYILMFADWCGHCQTYKPFWERLRGLSDKMVTLAAVQDTQKDNVPSLKDAPFDGYPTVIHVKEDNTKEAVGSTEMRSEPKMEARIKRTKDNGHSGVQQLLGNGGPIGKIIQAGAGLLLSARNRVHALFPNKTRKHGRNKKKRASRRNPRTRKAKRAGRKL